MKPKDITLIPIPLRDESKGAVGDRLMVELRQALRKDTMAEYVKTHPPR
jgi:hypothetical protein